MDSFRGRVAIVTGGASGIGQALCEELARRGTAVVVADINAAGAERVASTLSAAGYSACPVCADVAQAEDVRHLVDETAARYGRLDYMFNNAGIGLVAEMRDMSLAHWQRIIQVNLWGVIYGTDAAYRVMVQQGAGHIVNMASAAGLFPTGIGGTAYTATKHAVVGLSMALRPEAADLGVRVSVACPGVTRTGILDATTYVNIEAGVARAMATSFGAMEASRCARAILRGVLRNRAIIPITGLTRAGWWLYRLSPGLVDRLAREIARDFRRRVGLRDSRF